MKKKTRKIIEQNNSLTPTNVEKFILNRFKKPFSKKELSKALKIKDEQKLNKVVENLLKKGFLVVLKNNKFGVSSQMNIVSGVLDVNPKGFGFLIRDDLQDDIFIPLHLMGTALDKDRVLVKILGGKGGKRKEGKVVSVVERRSDRITGVLKKSGKFYYVVPDDKKILKNIFIDGFGIDLEKYLEKRVVVKLNDWLSPKLNPTGVIEKELKYENKLDLIEKMILIENGFSENFPEDVLIEVKKIRFNPEEDFKNRVDLTEKNIFTIDPYNAKDFDDAVSIEQKDNKLVLGVHIADVSYFVKENNPIDKEAFKRGTSVYLVSKTVPMLPEKLSNDICSLRPYEERYTITCEVTFNSNYDIETYNIFPSVIKSKRRFTYEEVEEILKTKKDDQFYTDLAMMEKLSNEISKKAFSEGRMDFDIPEVEISIDDTGNIKNIKEKKRLTSHKIIENFMITANNLISTFLTNNTRITIYRIHEEPDIEKLYQLKDILKEYGIKIKKFDGKELQSILEKSKNSDFGFIVRELILRSMMKAKYTTKNYGHYGLGLKYYTHFTSPIRRYPDLIVHRQLRKIIEGKLFDSADLEVIAKHSTEREIAAEKAERNAYDVAKLYYLKEHQKKKYEGVITSVTPFGMFIQIKDLFIDGLVRYRDIEDDFYHVCDDEISIYGVNTKKIITIGDKVLVKILNIVPERMILDLKIEKVIKRKNK
ncbi:MAG: ribonuclease R [candidate division WOR-3 bacterium]